MKLPNLNKGEFEKITKDKEGNEEYGFRTVDGLEEIVHIPTGKSNMAYFQPERLIDGKCQHILEWTNPATRELSCKKCPFGVTAHITSIEEDGDGVWINLPYGRFPVEE